MSETTLHEQATTLPIEEPDATQASAMPRVMVFIPAYRCEAQIKRVLGQFADSGATPACIDTIAVFDNQSPDGTISAAAEACAQLEGVPHLVVLRNCDNYGLGGSHKAAFRRAIESGMDYLIVLHGDDQAAIADIAPYLRSGEAFDYDCFLGSRFEKGARRDGYSAFRTFGNIVYNTLFSIVAGRRITDLGSGLNMYRVSSLSTEAVQGFPDNLTFNYVMLLWSFRQKHSIRFFPISWREQDQASNVKLVQQAVRVLWLLFQRWTQPNSFFAKDHREAPKAEYVSEVKFSSDAGR